MTYMIIPAKGFSSRIPRKNLQLFCGLPLVAWSVIQGVEAFEVDEVWVSTDCEEIADIVEPLGAQVMYRDYQDTDLTSGSVPVQEWACRMMEHHDADPASMCITRLCTTPTLRPGDVDDFMRCYYDFHERYGAKGIGVGAPCRTHIVSRRIVPGVDIHIPEATCHNDFSIMHHLAFMGVQPLHTFAEGADYYYDGQAMVMRDPEPMPPAKFSPGYCYEVEEWQMQDVDTRAEWEFAEVIMEHYILKGRGPEIYKET